MRNVCRKIALFLLIFLSGQPFSLAQDSNPPLFGYKFTNDSEEELIFMKLRRSLFSKTGPRDAQMAKFGLAEYYFKHNDYSDAFQEFKEYTNSYQPSESTLLAKTYLYKIALIKKDSELANSLRTEMFNNPFVLLFSKFKMLKYKSAFNNQYEIHYYLDDIKVFLNGELFEEFKP